MVKCPTCLENLEQKTGTRKFCAQIGNPDIAIVETKDPQFCNTCKEYYLTTKEIISAIVQISKLSENKKSIDVGVYS